MLIEFTVENHLSFKRRTTFSMRAAPLGDIHPHHLFATNENSSLLKSASLYGANAGGKTNLLRAMQFMRNWVRNSVREIGEPIPVQRFRLSTETDNEPSRFEMVFVAADTTYHYGFTTDPERIGEEWLAFEREGTEQELFRRRGSAIDVSSQFEEGRQLIDKVRPESLFLSVVAQFNGKTATAIVTWFQRLRFHFDDDPDPSTLIEVLSDTKRKEEFLKYVGRADLSIQDIIVEEPPREPSVDPEPDLASTTTPPRVAAFSSALLRRMKRTRLPTVHFLHRKFDANNNAIDNSPESFRFNNESAGTQKFLTLLVPILEALRSGSLLVVDELDTRFHPLLVQAVVGLFNSEENQNAQLLFTTHATSMLHRRFLRPDQIWFAEKDQFGATDLYSLIEYKLRDYSFSERDYVQGRYGAIPFVGDFSSLLSGNDGDG